MRCCQTNTDKVLEVSDISGLLGMPTGVMGKEPVHEFIKSLTRGPSIPQVCISHENHSSFFMLS